MSVIRVNFHALATCTVKCLLFGMKLIEIVFMLLTGAMTSYLAFRRYAFITGIVFTPHVIASSFAHFLIRR